MNTMKNKWLLFIPFIILISFSFYLLGLYHAKATVNKEILFTQSKLIMHLNNIQEKGGQDMLAKELSKLKMSTNSQIYDYTIAISAYRDNPKKYFDWGMAKPYGKVIFWMSFLLYLIILISTFTNIKEVICYWFSSKKTTLILICLYMIVPIFLSLWSIGTQGSTAHNQEDVHMTCIFFLIIFYFISLFLKIFQLRKLHNHEASSEPVKKDI